MRFARTLAAALAALFLLAAMAAWLVPPLLDWNRFRGSIAAIATERLGRKVVIGGAVTLRLLPEAVLTASHVTLPDEGDGISAELQSLRLQVALAPILSGRLVASDLVLGAPTLRLPWPLPPGIATPQRPLVPRGLIARIEGGSLQIGDVQAGSIDAAVLGDEATGAFLAHGGAILSGTRVRFDVRLGPPDARTSSALTVRAYGEGNFRDTSGIFFGQLSGGALDGKIELAGPDLARLLPAPKLAWRVSGRVMAGPDRIEAEALHLAAGSGTATASGMLKLQPALHLDLQLKAAELDGAVWLNSLAGWHWSGPAADLDLAVAKLQVLEGSITSLHASIQADHATMRLRSGTAMLPGGAEISLAGPIVRAKDGGLALTGPATLTAPDLRATASWLSRLSPELAGAFSKTGFARAVVSGQVSAAAGRLAVDGLTGTLDGDGVAGRLGIDITARPLIGIDLGFDFLDFGDLVSGGAGIWPPHWGAAGFDLDLRLRAKRARLQRSSLSSATVALRRNADSLDLLSATADLAGAHVSASGRLGAGDALVGGRLAVSAADAAAFYEALPQSLQAGDMMPDWRPGGTLWHGPASAQLVASGPPDALALQLSADAGDLRLEADSQADLWSGVFTTTMTLRHPGAPRLIAELGLGGAETWLNTGSMALLAHLQAGPGHWTVQDFTMQAAALRLAGSAAIDTTTPTVTISGRINAETLALPRMAMADWATWLAPEPPDDRQPSVFAAVLKRVSGSLHVNAAEMLVGLSPWASDVAGDVAFGGGIAVASGINAAVLGGKISAQAALDYSTLPRRLSVQAAMTGAAIPGATALWPIEFVSGVFDASLRADMVGAGLHSEAAVTGAIQATGRDLRLAGIDMQHLVRALTPSGPIGATGGAGAATAVPGSAEADIRQALGSGVTETVHGSIDAMLDATQSKAAASGIRVTLKSGRLAAPSGLIDLDGWVDFGIDTADLRLGVTPDVAFPPLIAVTLKGGLDAPKRTDDIAAALAWHDAAASVLVPKKSAPRQQVSSAPKPRRKRAHAP